MSMIKLDDAVDVIDRVLRNYYGYSFQAEDFAYLRQELEQKAWVEGYPKDDPVRRLINLIMDIHPENIAEHIKVDSLIDWCEQIQVEMELALVQIGRTSDIKINGTSTKTTN